MATGLLSEFPEAVQYPSLQPNSNEVALVPYAKVGGEWTLPDDVVLSLAARAVIDGTFESVFMDGAVRGPEDFLGMMQKQENVPIFVFAGPGCVGAGWLNGCIGSVAFAHFLLLRNGHGQLARRAGRLVLNYWRAFMVDDERLFEVIIGVVPSSKWWVTRFAQDIGFVRLGEIPKMLRGESATLLYLTG